MRLIPKMIASTIKLMNVLHAQKCRAIIAIFQCKIKMLTILKTTFR